MNEKIYNRKFTYYRLIPETQHNVKSAYQRTLRIKCLLKSNKSLIFVPFVYNLIHHEKIQV